MRGKANGNKFIDGKYRITPAYAGKRCTPSEYLEIIKDHPRLCGEKIAVADSITSILGSPPPMRGKVTVLVFGSMILRITPAYAGKSTIDGGKHDRSKDHPRLCGEKVCLCHMKKESKGSPPPMRGKVVTFTLCGQSPRITPAYAGKRQRMGLVFYGH